MKKSKLFKIALITMAVVLIAAISMPLFSSAANVVILSEKNPTLTLEKIHEATKESTNYGYGETIVGSFKQENNVDTLTSNGYTQWYASDSISFAYKKVIFNYPKSSVLTLEANLEAWNGKHATAGAGIMLRSGLQPGAATVMMHARPESIMFTYRAQEDGMSAASMELRTDIKFPIKLKIVLKGNKVECFYQRPSDSAYIKMGACSFIYGPSVYIGEAAYTCEPKFEATAKFTNLYYQIEAPEGTEVSTDEGTGGGGDTPSAPEVETVVLPEDPPVSSDVLLRETFTDGSMFEGKEDITNPIWKSKNPMEPEIVTTADNTNRYLYEFMSTSAYRAGDENWTDYETTIDLMFTDDYTPEEKNIVDIYTRLTSVTQYGFHSYVLRFSGGDTLQLGAFNGRAQLSGSQSLSTNVKELASVEFDVTKRLGVMLHLTIRTMDNKVTVYLREGDSTENVKLLSIEDTTHNVKSTGCIGFATDSAAVTIDNIQVVKLEDYLGGDYDNRIAGLWDRETPAYIQEYIDAEFKY